ncbi:hypothetical protein H8356DRAFT_1348186 [Neocallimastix lanati (nom. inval.)]|nr:hypothetical protein H8356DRAFT_1348186 [Neocallimastix sp. JGI-2020a]
MNVQQCIPINPEDKITKNIEISRKFNKYSGTNNNSLVSIHGDDSSSFYVSIEKFSYSPIAREFEVVNLAGAHSSEKERYLD